MMLSDFLLAWQRALLFWKVFSLQGKNFLQGSKFSPFRVDPFFDGGQNILTNCSPEKMYQFL